MKTLLIRVLRSLLTFLGGSVPASAPAPSVPITAVYPRLGFSLTAPPHVSCAHHYFRVPF